MAENDDAARIECPMLSAVIAESLPHLGIFPLFAHQINSFRKWPNYLNISVSTYILYLWFIVP